MAVSALLMVLLLTAVQQVARTTSRASASASAFDEARIAFGEMRSRIAQATLSPYWNVYYDSQGNPAGYNRKSDLHFLCGPASSLVPNRQTSGDAIFFQAATGFDPQQTGEGSALNAEGFFVEYRNVNADRPFAGITGDKWRFQLRAFRQPASELQVFNPASTPNTAWFQAPLAATNAPVTTLADNVALLIIRVRTLNQQGAETYYFDYDSRSWPGTGTQPVTSHQIPPVVDVVMLALDRETVERMDGGSTMPSLVPATLFTDETKLDEDVAALEASLATKFKQSAFRVFRASVPIRSAKWSTD